MTIEGILTQIKTPKRWASVRDVSIFKCGETMRDGTKTLIRVYSALPDSLIGRPVEFDEQIERVAMTEEARTCEYIVQSISIPNDGIEYQSRAERESMVRGKREGILRAVSPNQGEDGTIHILFDNGQNDRLKPVRLFPSWHTDYDVSIKGLIPLVGKFVEVENIETMYTRNQIPISFEMTRRFTDTESGREFVYSWFVD